MGELTFQVHNKTGQASTFTVSNDGSELTISKASHIHSIDLSPLSQLPDLQKLRIEKTSIQKLADLCNSTKPKKSGLKKKLFPLCEFKASQSPF